MQSLDGWLRRVLAYTTLFGFIFAIFLYGVAESLSGMHRDFGPLMWQDQISDSSIPDFSRYKFLRKISAEDFPIDDRTRRVIITGDLHGMIKPLENLLHDLDYSPTKDVFIHVGDIVTRGPHKGSMTLLAYLASNNITGVRGNNDQTVIEWRGWLNWIASLPGGKGWLERIDHISPNDETDQDKLVDWMAHQRNAASKNDKKWWKRIPHGWVLFTDHYKVARDMSASEFQYLLDLPLRLYVPSAHVFIVHAGLLPSNPEYPYYDDRQPLARVPKLEGTNVDASKLDKISKDVETLRNLQDFSLLTLIPQNLIPWVVLNMRSVKNGKVSKKGKGKGRTPWSDLWNQQMNSCVGYDYDVDGKEVSASKKALPCYPSTVVYGHAAARRLDLKRWSIGLDSGCVYGRKLSALVIGGTEDEPRRNSEDQSHNDEVPTGQEPTENYDRDDSNSMKQEASFLFADHARARIQTVKCQR